MKNRGLLIAEPRLTDYRFGSFSSLPSEVLSETGEWADWLPSFEPQSIPEFDTMACVTFSALNCVETLISRKFQVVENFSDRYTATVSGTTSEGNFAYKVGDSIKKDGLLGEVSWPWTPDIVTRLEYLAPVPLLLKTTALTIYDKYRFSYEFIYREDFLSGLRMAPIQIAIRAYGAQDENGILQPIEGAANHMVMLYGAEEGRYWKIYDHYEQKYKKLAWTYLIPFGVRYHVERPPKVPIMNIANNTLIQLSEGAGGFALVLDGKKIIDQLDKVLASWLVRNGGDTRGKVMVVSLAVWNSLPTINLKREPV